MQENRVSFSAGWCIIKFQRWGVSGKKWAADSEREKEGGQGLCPTMQYCVLQRNGDKEETTERLFQHVMEIELYLKKEWEITGGWEPEKRY